VYARIAAVESLSDRPYLPHPFPLKRVGRARDGHQGGFTSLQDTGKPKNPEKEEVHCTYPEWWWAQQPPFGPAPEAEEQTFSTSFWPYGRRMSAIASVDDKGEFYDLDDRRIKNHAFVKQHQREQSKFQAFPSRSQSATDFLGSNTEFFNHSKSLGQTVSSHHGAAFHENSKLVAALGSSAGAAKTRTVWDRTTQGVDGSARRTPSAPCLEWSMEAAAASSRYNPHRSLRDLGLGSRTHAEWRLPEHPVRPSTPWK
jgi:hypothetical protein